jgi:ethanolamine utilization protein EutA
MHDLDEEHYHDDEAAVAAHGDTVTWTTVGLDVGSSTAQILFSRITLEREDSYYVVVARHMLHESEVILTPYASPRVIDRQALSGFIEREFARAGLARDAIDTGAVILTGLALTATNARAIAEALSDESGRFVAVSAGDLLEARLAASGAGLPALSAERRGTIAHVDVGGGTTKLSLWRGGQLLGLAALDVGARLVQLDAEGRIVQIEEPIERVAAASGLELAMGEVLDSARAQALARALAECITSHAGLARGPLRLPSLLRTAPLVRGSARPRIDAVLFSGGVSEYIYGRERRTFGDLGPWLGRAIRTQAEASGVEILPFERGIRATVLGASQHSAQLSGNTIHLSADAPLPLRNVPVVLARLDLSAETLDHEALVEALSEALALNGPSTELHAPALAIRWAGTPSFARLSQLARAIAQALEGLLAPADPCIVLVEGDVAGVLGRRLERAYGGARAVICLDGVHVHEFDHLDVGSPAARTRAVPVVVKSLLFAAPPASAHHHHHREHHHHHV